MGAGSLEWQLRRNRKGKNNEPWIQQPFGRPNTRCRYLGDHQYFSKLGIEREEADLDNCGGAAAGSGLNPVVFPRATGSQVVASPSGGAGAALLCCRCHGLEATIEARCRRIVRLTSRSTGLLAGGACTPFFGSPVSLVR